MITPHNLRKTTKAYFAGLFNENSYIYEINIIINMYLIHSIYDDSLQHAHIDALVVEDHNHSHELMHL